MESTGWVGPTVKPFASWHWSGVSTRPYCFSPSFRIWSGWKRTSHGLPNTGPYTMAMGPGWTQTMSFGASPLISLQGVAPGEGEFGRVGLVACLLFYLAGDQSSTAK